MIHVAIVSHGHEAMLLASRMGGLLDARDGIRLWVKDNRPSALLRECCAQNGVRYLDAQPGLGFGANNNLLFAAVRNEPDYQDSDFFVVMNPDITLTAATLHSLTDLMRTENEPLATLNLYRDAGHLEYDANIRRFPDWRALGRMAMVRSLSEPYDKAQMALPCHVDWASGALIAFEARLFARLNGFDPRYFMYFEDVDLCYRAAALLGHGVRYYPQLQALHAAAHKNRNLISRHALWFLRSFMQFLLQRYFGAPQQRPRPLSVHE